MRYLYKIILFTIISLIFFPANDLLCKKKLRIGLVRYKHDDVVFKQYDKFFQYITNKLNYNYDLKILKGDELGYELANGNFDIGIFTPFPYLEAKMNFPQLEAFATNKVFGSNTNSGAIIVKKSSGIERLEQLRDKKFLFIRPTSTSGYKVPKSIFQEFSIDIDDGFFSYDFSGGHQTSVEKLLADSVDGIAIDIEELKHLSKEELQELRILREYKLPMHAYVFSPFLDKQIKDKIKDVMFNAHKDHHTKSMFENELGIEAFVQIDDEHYNPMRRYLRLVRIKPFPQIDLEIAESAKAALSEKGDLLDIIKDNIENEVMSTSRFAARDPKHTNYDNYAHIKVSLSRIDKDYYYQIFLDNVRVANGNITEIEIIESLHAITINSVLNNMDIHTELITAQNKWFITYGSNDGMNMYDYFFILNDGNNTKLQIDSINEFNTYFTPIDAFQEGQTILISYFKTDKELNFSGKDALSETDAQSIFVAVSDLDELDNVWGIIGIVLLVVSGAVSYVLIRVKHRRFRNILYKANDLLKEFIEGKYVLEAKLIEHTEYVNKALEKGYINENQFLILKNRIEEITNLVENQSIKNYLTIPEIRAEIDKILEDGKITEKEYSRLTTILSRIKKKKDKRESKRFLKKSKEK